MKTLTEHLNEVKNSLFVNENKNNPFVKLLEIYAKTHKTPTTKEVEDTINEIGVLNMSKFNIETDKGMDDTILIRYTHTHSRTGLTYKRTFCSIIFNRVPGQIMLTFGDYVQKDSKELKDEYKKLTSKLIKEYGFTHNYGETFIYKVK